MTLHWGRGPEADLEGRRGRVGQQVHEHGLAHTHPPMHVKPRQLALLRLGWRPSHQSGEPAHPVSSSAFAKHCSPSQKQSICQKRLLKRVIL